MIFINYQDMTQSPKRSQKSHSQFMEEFVHKRSQSALAK